MKIRVTGDSTCDLSKELIERYDISILPLKVILGDKTYIDGVDIVPADIFAYVKKTGVLPKTAAPTAEEFEGFFEEQLKTADEIIHFDISAKASSTYNNAVVAARRFGGKVHVVDSMVLSTGIGLLMLKACDLIQAGKSAQETVAEVEALRPKLNTSFVPDVLDYLHKGGRCSLLALMGAKVLKLHPFIDMKDGAMYARKKYMGSIDRCIKSYIADLAALYPEYDKTRCFITHSDADPALVEKAKALVKETFDFEEVFETNAGNVVTSHCGRNTLGVLFISR